VGLLEEIDKLELSDEAKTKLKKEYGVEVGTKDDELEKLRRRNRKSDVEKEIDDLKALFGDKPEDQAPGLLKFVRRVYLSDDQQPGSVLLSDADLELSGDEATGARSEEEISVAGAVREFIKLMPRSQDGKLKVMLADQANASGDHGRPGSEEEEGEEAQTEKRKRVESTLGRPVERKRDRYKGSVS
jgi:hypothetical protein